jgi:hypothetical protein
VFFFQIKEFDNSNCYSTFIDSTAIKLYLLTTKTQKKTQETTRIIILLFIQIKASSTTYQGLYFLQPKEHANFIVRPSDVSQNQDEQARYHFYFIKQFNRNKTKGQNHSNNQLFDISNV